MQTLVAGILLVPLAMVSVLVILSVMLRGARPVFVRARPRLARAPTTGVYRRFGSVNVMNFLIGAVINAIRGLGEVVRPAPGRSRSGGLFLAIADTRTVGRPSASNILTTGPTMAGTIIRQTTSGQRGWCPNGHFRTRFANLAALGIPGPTRAPAMLRI